VCVCVCVCVCMCACVVCACVCVYTPEGCETKEEEELMTRACGTRSCASGIACSNWFVAASQTKYVYVSMRVCEYVCP